MTSTNSSFKSGHRWDSCHEDEWLVASMSAARRESARGAYRDDFGGLCRPCEKSRKYVSCTASSASAIDPSMRYARPSRRRRYGSKLAAGFEIALVEVTSFAPS